MSVLIEKSDLKTQVTELAQTVENLSRRVAALERAVQTVAPKLGLRCGNGGDEENEMLDDHVCSIA